MNSSGEQSGETSEEAKLWEVGRNEARNSFAEFKIYTVGCGWILEKGQAVPSHYYF